MKVDEYWMRKIHPKIEDFWLNSGYKIAISKPPTILPNSMWCVVWVATKDSDHRGIAVTETIGGPKGKTEDTCDVLYCWDGQLFSEEKMLRIIRLKAFI